MAKRAAHVDALVAAWAAGNYATARRLAASTAAGSSAEVQSKAALARGLRAGGYGLALGLGALIMQLAAWAWVLRT